MVFLSILFLGPPIAALFIATGIPIMTGLGWTARSLLSTYVCPTPIKTYELLGAPMAVCTRCWGATIGLWLGWFISTRTTPIGSITNWYSLPPYLRFLMAIVPFALWWLEIRYWPTASYEVLLLNGILAGTTAGMFFCSIYPGMRRHA
jgi:uncharacterized membrane protein